MSGSQEAVPPEPYESSVADLGASLEDLALQLPIDQGEMSLAALRRASETIDAAALGDAAALRRIQSYLDKAAARLYAAQVAAGDARGALVSYLGIIGYDASSTTAATTESNPTAACSLTRNCMDTKEAVVEERRVGDVDFKVALSKHNRGNMRAIAGLLEDCDVVAIETTGLFEGDSDPRREEFSANGDYVAQPRPGSYKNIRGGF